MHDASPHCCPRLEIEQMDVVTAFLNSKVDSDIYMALPLGIEV